VTAPRPLNDKRVRIWYLIDTLHVFGGTERQLRELINHLDRSRFDPLVLTLYSADMPHAAEFDGMGCAVHSLKIPRLLSLRGLLAIWKLSVSMRRDKVRIIHTFFPDAAIVGIIAARLAGARVIVGRRDLGYWYSKRYLFILRRLQHFAHAYIVNSVSVRDAVIAAEGVGASRVHVVHNGFFGQPSDTPDFTLEQFGVPRNAKVVGTVANLRDVKRLDRFVEMAAGIRDPQAYFLIVGYGELHDALVQQAESLGLADRFRIIHSISNVYHILSRFHVGVLTSESEGLSNTLIEYGLAGVPAVAFDVGGNREVIDDHASGFLVSPYDITELGRHVEKLLADDDLRNRFGAHAKRICASRFAGQRMVDETLEIYRSVYRKSS
jgi:L-malate glycosyltransferase